MRVKEIPKQYQHIRDKGNEGERETKQYLHIRDKGNEGDRET